MSSKKILLISIFDYAGSGYRLAEAINLNTNNFVQYLVMLPVADTNNFTRTPAVCNVTKDGKYSVSKQNIDRVNSIIENVDIVHYKGDFLPNKGIYEYLKPHNKPSIITTSGSFFRVGNSPTSFGKGNFDDYIAVTDVRTTQNPDLNYPKFDATYTPIAYDVDKYLYSWKRRDVPIISHSPSTRGKKGTDLFLQACKELEKDYKFEINIIENKTLEECLEEKSRSTIFFDQIGCGSYGNSSIEAMAFGIPTICHIAERSYSQSGGRLSDCPIINCGTTVESLKGAIKSVLDGDLERISIDTRLWCQKEHGYSRVAKLWNNIYNKTLRSVKNEN